MQVVGIKFKMKKGILFYVGDIWLFLVYAHIKWMRIDSVWVDAVLSW